MRLMKKNLEDKVGQNNKTVPKWQVLGLGLLYVAIVGGGKVVQDYTQPQTGQAIETNQNTAQ